MARTISSRLARVDRRSSAVAIFLASLALGVANARPSFAAEQHYAYVANQGSDSVSVIDRDTETVIDTIPLGPGRMIEDIAFSPDGSQAYVSESGLQEIRVIDTVARRVIAGIRLSGRPRGVATTPDGKRLYVAMVDVRSIVIDTETYAITTLPLLNGYYVAVTPDGTTAYFAAVEAVVAVDVATNTVARVTAVPSGSHGIVVSPDGRFVYSVNLTCPPLSRKACVSVIDRADGDRVLNHIVLDEDGQDLRISPDGRYLYAPSFQTGRVTVIDTMQRAVADVITRCGKDNLGVEVSPDGRWLYVKGGIGRPHLCVIDRESGDVVGWSTFLYGNRVVRVNPSRPEVYAGAVSSIDVIDTSSGRRMHLLRGGQNPAGLTVSPDGTTLYVANPGTGTLSVIDTQTRTLTDEILTEGLSLRAAVHPSGRLVYVTDYQVPGGLHVIDAQTHQVLAKVPLVGETGGVAITADGRRAYATSYYNVQLIDLETNAVAKDIALNVSGTTIGNGTNIAIAPSQLFAYTPGFNRNVVREIDLQANEWINDIDVDQGLHGLQQGCDVAFSPDGRFAYVANYPNAGDTIDVSVIDTNRAAMVGTVDISNGGELFAPRSCGVAVAPESGTVYVTNRDYAHVDLIDPATNTVRNRLPVGFGPFGVAMGCIGCPVDPIAAPPLPAPSPTPQPGALELTIGSAVGPPANYILIPVSLHSGGTAFALEHTLSHVGDRFTVHVERCSLPENGIKKRFTASLLPRDAPAGRTNLHTFIESLDVAVGPIRKIPNQPLADGLVYSCVARVTNDTPPGEYPVRTVMAALYDHDGQPLEPLTTTDAVITVTDPASSTGCLMDCYGRNQVTVDDVVIGIGIALGLAPLERCPVADANGDEQVTIDELVLAVRAALYGCYMSIPAEG